MDLVLAILGNFPALIFRAFVVMLWLVVTFWMVRLIFKIIKEWYRDYVEGKFSQNEMEYVLLELQVPNENDVFPKAIEQGLTSFYQAYTFGINFEQKWIYGWHEKKFSLEITGSKEGIRFFIRTERTYQHLVESAILSHYPEARIFEVADYVKEMPVDLPNEEWDLKGSDMILAAPDHLPIKTYPYFFGEMQKEMILDPIAQLTEAISSITNDDKIWIQFVIRPLALSAIKDKAKKAVADIMKKAQEDGDRRLNDVEREVIKMINAKANKLTWETMIRYIVVGKRGKFDKNRFWSVMGYFQQFGHQTLNSFRPGKGMVKRDRFGFVNSRLELKKHRVWKHYINRAFSTYSYVDHIFINMFGLKNMYTPTFLMNVEELATIWHPPITKVVAEGLRGLEVKKGTPPQGLPIMEDE